MKKGKVFIVGAGPGDPELITLKGLKALHRADVVLYDKLAPPELLKEVPAEAERIFVGKSKGRHPIPQEKINQLMIQKALDGKTVVRLKGGDPLIFGRLAEEIEALEKAGITYEIIPGITAASAAAAEARIPLTHRDKASILSFITGHRKNNQPLNLPYQELAKTGGTIVIYMGVSTSEQISKGLIAAGMNPETPTLIACSVGTPNQTIYKTTIENLPNTIKEKRILPPAIIIVGNTVIKNWRGREDSNPRPAD